MPIIVEHTFVGALVDDSLSLFSAGALFAFKSPNRDRAKFDPLNCLPRLGFKLDQFNPVEAALSRLLKV